jgi:2-methylcitrate dehydratase PrpD
MADSAIVQYVQRFQWAAQSSETQRLTKRAVLDLLGCALAGSRHHSVPQVANTIEEIDGKGCNKVWGTNRVMDVKGAIFMNAYTGALFDMDDGHRRAQGHPGAVLVPAAITVASRNRNTGVEMLEAIALGYDVAVREAVRIREAGGPRKGSSGWCAPGAAVTVGKLLKLTDGQMAHAIGLAEYFTPQAGQDRSVNFPSLMKEGIPWGAYTGSFCAHLAKGGFTAHRPHLSDAEDLVKDLGERVEVNYAYYKKWAACRWAHPALSGLSQIKEEMGLSLKNIESVTLRSFEKGLLLNNPAPTSTLQAVYSIPFSLAYFTKHGKIDPDDLMDEQAMVADTEILAMARKIRLEHAPEYTEKFPMQCIQDVEVKFVDGRVASRTGLESPGDPGNLAFTDEEILTKFRTLAEPVVGERWSDIVQAVEEIDGASDLNHLVGLLTVF